MGIWGLSMEGVPVLLGILKALDVGEVGDVGL
jgi:hypothetical protein